jgi:hypothetical protein
MDLIGKDDLSITGEFALEILLNGDGEHEQEGSEEEDVD